MEERLIKEQGQESRIAQLIEPIIADTGFQLVRVRLLEHNGVTLQVMAERPDGALKGTMSVEDCEQLSKALSPFLDIEDPISSKYQLEISSPGIDRPLVRLSDFATWSGHQINIETTTKIDGRRKLKGILLKVESEKVILRHIEGSENFEVPLNILSKAKLVLSESLIREALRRDKAARRGKDIIISKGVNKMESQEKNMENSHGC